MSKLIKRLLTALTLAMSINTAHAGIPVIDAASIAQAILQVQAWGEQYNQMVTQITNTTGSRGLGLILNDPAVKAALPANWGNVLTTIQTTALYTAERAKYPTLASNPTQNAVYDQIAANNATMTDMFNKANGRLAQVESLLNRINSASDPAAKQDLNNRLVNEQNAIAATNQLIALLKEKQKQDTEAAEHAAYKSFQCKQYGRVC